MTALACVGWSAGLANAHAQMPTEQAASVAGGEPERMALGLIVKLREPGPAPTFSARAHRAGQRVSRASSMSLQRERDVLATVTQRHRVSYLVQRRTAFAANLIHAGHPVRLSEAREQARRLRADPQVEWVVVNEIEKPAAVTPPNDTHHGSQTWLHSPTGTALARPDFTGAWAEIDQWRTQHAGRDPAPVVVAVLDTGIVPHEDLPVSDWGDPSGRVIRGGYDFVSNARYANDGSGPDADPSDPGDWVDATDKADSQAFGPDCAERPSSWHGLHVAGVLAASTNNGLGIAGVLAPLKGPVLLPVRIAGKCGAAVSDIIEGMLWAAGVSYSGSPLPNPTPARIINLSFGGQETCDDASAAQPNSPARLYTQVVQTLKDKGALVVASAGNGNGVTPLMGLDGATRPASCRGVLAVTALNEQGFKATYANLVTHGLDSRPAIATVGADPFSDVATREPFQYALDNAGDREPEVDTYDQVAAGTSFSAPLVAGTAALMLAVQPGLTVDQLIRGLIDTSTDFPASPVVAPPGLAACGPAHMGNCNCRRKADLVSASTSASTCGAGMLNAAAAVAWAANVADADATFTDSPVTAPYFTPVRGGQPTERAGGGGGGAVDLWALLGLALAFGVSGWRTGRRNGQDQSGR